jgi:hypothetical protein
VDNDGDGIADCFDQCDASIDTDGDGTPDCTDPCDDRIDSDGDGTPDCTDPCDDRIDTDGDGIPDCEDDCDDNSAAEITGLSLNQDTFLPSENIQLTINGNLNDATNWVIYDADGCGVNEITSSSSSIIDLSLLAISGSSTIYVRGEGGCVGDTACTSIDIVVLPAPGPADVLINEFQPNPPGGDPATQTLELKGPAGQLFTGWVVVLDADSGSSGQVNDFEEISGTFDINGLLTVSIADIENPSFTLLVTDVYTPRTADFDADENGQLDTDISALGNVYDAIGVPDAVGDEQYLYGAELGGEDFKFTGSEPELIFRDRDTNAWYAINDHDGDMAHDIDGNTVPFISFGGSLTTPTFGIENPYLIVISIDLSIRPWPNPATDELHLDISKAGMIKSFELYDMAGRFLRSIPASSTRNQVLDVQDLDTGVYLIRANTKNYSTLNMRFIKRR